MTKEDKQTIDRAIKENWRKGDRKILRRLLEKNLKLYFENTELENKIADIKANCDLAIEGRDIKIKELEEQIEKAIDIIRDLGSTVREGVTCHYLVDNGGLHRATLFIREIKENEIKDC